MFLTPAIERAIVRSAELHRDQVRKGNGSPYVVHPYAVAFLLAHFGADEVTIIAGLLHDVLEDVPGYSAETLRQEFGAEVMKIVREVSEDEQTARDASGKTTRDSWRIRKERYLSNLENDGEKALWVAAADKICNLRSLATDYSKSGEAVWEVFLGKKEGTFWFFESAFKILEGRLGNVPIVREYEETLRSVREQMSSP